MIADLTVRRTKSLTKLNLPLLVMLHQPLLVLLA